jgi:hypothetical protein
MCPNFFAIAKGTIVFFAFFGKGLSISSRTTWISNRLGVGGTKVDNPPRCTNYIVRLLQFESKIDPTLLQLDFASKYDIDKGRRTKGGK